MKFLCILMVSFLVFLPTCLVAQEEGETSLADLARQIRQKKTGAPAARSVIDNDNLPQVMDEAASHHGSGLMFSFDGAGKSFQVSTSPDVTCSLSFNASNASLLSSMYVAQNLPDRELTKLDGPAVIQGNSLRVTVYNGSQWNVREITIGITIVKRPGQDNASVMASADLDRSTAATASSSERRPDVTVLYHLKGSATPFTTTLFQAPMPTPIAPGQEWHWAVVEAKGLPPQATTIGQAGN
jgi:hypothetical protein